MLHSSIKYMIEEEISFQVHPVCSNYWKFLLLYILKKKKVNLSTCQLEAGSFSNGMEQSVTHWLYVLLTSIHVCFCAMCLYGGGIIQSLLPPQK